MYQIKRQGGSVPKNLQGKWPTYEKARQAVRKWLRAMFKQGRKSVADANTLLHRTPSHSHYGFTINLV